MVSRYRIYECEPPSKEQLDAWNAVAVDRGFVKSYEEIELAYFLAKRSFSKKPLAKQFRYEFLLWLTGEKDISKAIKKSTPKKRAVVIIFSDVSLSYPSPSLKERGEPLDLERISLSRV